MLRKIGLFICLFILLSAMFVFAGEDPFGQIRNLYTQGKYSEALTLSNNILTELETKHGKKAYELGDVLIHITMIYEKTGDIDKAISTLERWRKIQEDNLGFDDRSIAKTFEILITLYEKSGNTEQVSNLNDEAKYRWGVSKAAIQKKLNDCRCATEICVACTDRDRYVEYLRRLKFNGEDSAKEYINAEIARYVSTLQGKSDPVGNLFPPNKKGCIYFKSTLELTFAGNKTEFLTQFTIKRGQKDHEIYTETFWIMNSMLIDGAGNDISKRREIYNQQQINTCYYENIQNQNEQSYQMVYISPPDVPQEFRIKHLTKYVRLQINVASLYSMNKLLVEGEQQNGELLSKFLNTFNIYVVSDY